MQKTHPFSTAKINISQYHEIIKRYLSVVLIRCVRYTNSYRLAEVISIYVFICVYRLTELLDGYNLHKIIEMMVDIVGEDLAPCRPLRTRRKGSSLSCEQLKGFKPVNGRLLFKWEDDLLFAKQLSCLKIDECLDVISRHKDFITRNLDEALLNRITGTVMDYLLNQS